MLETISRTSLNETVFEKLKSSIINNVLKPGEKLTVESLSKKLGVSRTPVSNALQALEKDGYIVILPQNGTYVRELTSEELAVIYDLREVIEGLVAKLIIKNINREKLSQYLKSFHEFLEYDSYDEDIIERFYSLELEFHDYLVSACPYIIKNEIRNIVDLTKRSRKLLLQHEVSVSISTVIKDKDIKLHMQLIESLLCGDVETAENIAKQDVRDTKTEVLKYFY